MYVRNLRPLAALALLGFPGSALALVEGEEPVPTFALEAPERDRIDPKPELLPDGASGIFTDVDGGHFVLLTRKSGLSVEDEAEVLEALKSLLPATGWALDPEAVLKVREGSLRLQAPDAAWYEKEHSDLRSVRLARLEDELGELSTATIDAVDELAADAGRYTTEDRLLYRVDQYVDGVRAEGVGVSVIVADTTVLAVHGALYGTDEVDNFAEYDAEGAWYRVQSELSDRVEKFELLSAEEVVVPVGKELRKAWHLEALLDDGAHGLWVDRGSGELLQLLANFHAVSAQGRVADPTPDDGFTTLSFDVDPSVDGVYTLSLAGVASVSNAGADGVVNGTLQLADDGSGFADFDVGPFNGTTVADATAAGYNGWFGDVNLFGWAAWQAEMYALWGALPFDELSIITNDDWVCGYGKNNACASGSTLRFGIGGLTLGEGSGLVNTALDTPVLSHELGHFVNHVHFDDGGGVLGGSINEGLADHWSHMFHDDDLIGYYTIQSQVDVEDGGVPRAADPDDVFPEHMWAYNESHANGQVMAWAMWSTLQGMEDKTFLGKLVLNIRLLDAMVTAGVGASSSVANKPVHDAYWALMADLVALEEDSANSHEILAGFARAGITASPREAVIDIDDDYIAGSAATPPTFTVWTGRDFEWSGTAAVAGAPYLDHYEIEVANDAAFTTNLVSSGTRTDVAVSPEGVPMATWQLASADWDSLRGGDRLYYRVTAWTLDGSTVVHERTSRSAFGGTVELPAQYAVINNTGTMDEEICGDCGAVAGRRGVAGLTLAALGLLLGLRRRR